MPTVFHQSVRVVWNDTNEALGGGGIPRSNSTWRQRLSSMHTPRVNSAGNYRPQHVFQRIARSLPACLCRCPAPVCLS